MQLVCISNKPPDIEHLENLTTKISKLKERRHRRRDLLAAFAKRQLSCPINMLLLIFVVVLLFHPYFFRGLLAFIFVKLESDNSTFFVLLSFPCFFSPRNAKQLSFHINVQSRPSRRRGGTGGYSPRWIRGHRAIYCGIRTRQWKGRRTVWHKEEPSPGTAFALAKDVTGRTWRTY